MTRAIIVGSRASALALAQTHMMVQALQTLHPTRSFTVLHITTHGDRVLDRSLTAIGGKGVFVKEIEDALLSHQIDLAVHSYKDLPTEQPFGLVVGAITERADPRDVLVTRTGCTLADLPQGARVGTSSLRRRVQLLAARPDLQIADIRGNVDTRLRKLDEGQYDGIVLAAAGLDRLGLAGRAVQFFDPLEFLPAPAQGALALEIRSDDSDLAALIAPLDHAPTRAAVTAERGYLSGLGGGCDLPIGAYANATNGRRLAVRGMLAGPDASSLHYAETEGDLDEADALGRHLAEMVLAAPAGRKLLPLAGLRVLVTRPEGQADDLADRLKGLGAQPVICATIRIVPPASFEPMDRAIQELDGYDWVIFTSVNGVRYFLDRLEVAGLAPGALDKMKLAAIGPATAAALRDEGLQPALVPQRYIAEAILDEIGDVAGQQILLPRADIARKALAEGLRAAGAQVTEVAAYRTVAADDDLPAGPVDIATFTSPSTVRNFVSLVEASGQTPGQYLKGAEIACIGPITEQAALAEGLRVDLVAERHTVDGLLEAILEQRGKRAT